jgi:hypothetical protein
VARPPGEDVSAWLDRGSLGGIGCTHRFVDSCEGLGFGTLGDCGPESGRTARGGGVFCSALRVGKRMIRARRSSGIGVGADELAPTLRLAGDGSRRWK